MRGEDTGNGATEPHGAGASRRYRDLSGRAPGLSLTGVDAYLDADPGALSELFHGNTALQELLHRLGAEKADGDGDLARGAAIAFSLVSANRVGRCDGFPYDSFWSQSLARAVAAQHLARALGHAFHREAFLAALFWRIGALALAGAFPAEYARFLSASPLDSLEELRTLEHGRFGVDHVELSRTLLDELGYPESCRVFLRDLCDQREDSERFDVLRVAERVASICALEEEDREGRWHELVEVRRGLGLERDAFSALGDSVIHAWWEWGEALDIPTKPMASFYALDQTGTLDRELLGLPTVKPRRSEDSSLHVLVVDDDPTTLAILEAQLRRGGHHVRTATDGDEALRTALQHSPDVVVADWIMPEMDGLELCRALRRYEAGRHLFFVLLTGRDEEEHVKEAFEAGVDDFLTKDARQGLLVARMTAARRVIDLREQVKIDQRMLKQQLVKQHLLVSRRQEAAWTDVLTELPNRRCALRRLDEEWAATERTGLPLSLVMLDVDHFKRINDTYGHDVGDVVLRSVADALEQITRRNEVACRFGGEEFLVICRDTSRSEVLRCGERIRKAIQTHVVGHAPFDEEVTVSVGVATRDPVAMERVEDLIRATDRAVYAAKEGGRNRTCIDGEPPGPREAGGEDPGGNDEIGWAPGRADSEGDEAA